MTNPVVTRRSSVVKAGEKPNPRAERIERLISQADLNLQKIRRFEAYLESRVGQSQLTFLSGDLTRFHDSHEAHEMLAYARVKAPEAAASQQPYDETLKSKYQNFLVSALILVLMEVYFCPSKEEMKSFIGLASRWFKAQKRNLSELPVEEIEKWKTQNEARLRTLEDVQQKFNKDEAPATLEALFNRGQTSTQMDTKVFRPAIGLTPARRRGTFRNTRGLTNLKVNGGPNPVYDWNSDPKVANHVNVVASNVKQRNLIESHARRLTNAQSAHDELYFGDNGHFRGNITKDEVKGIVSELFKAKENLRKKLETPSALDPEQLEKKEQTDHITTPKLTTPREDVESESKLTSKFSSPEHIASSNWHKTTLGFVSKSQRAFSSPPSSKSKNNMLATNTSALFARSRSDVEARPDMLYGVGSSRALRAGAAANAKSSGKVLNKRATIRTILATEAFNVEGDPNNASEAAAALFAQGGEMVVKMPTFGRRNSANNNHDTETESEEEEEEESEDDDEAEKILEEAKNEAGVEEEEPPPPFQPQTPQSRINEELIQTAVAKKSPDIPHAPRSRLQSVGAPGSPGSPFNTKKEFSSYVLNLSSAIKGSALHNMTADDPDAWLLQHDMLARRQPLTPRLRKTLEKIEAKSARPKSAPAGGKKVGKGGGQKKAPPKGKKKPAGKKKGGGKGGDGKKKVESEFKTSMDFMDSFMPSWRSEGRSLLRVKEDEDVSKISRLFKQHSLPIDRAAVERGLRTQMDRPNDMVWRNLPLAGQGLMVDPTIAAAKLAKAAVKKAGGRKKKKSGKKKKAKKKK
ncbi:hypothetical protein TrVE_jg12790 [Triparma verrucosa]|uniref:Uncharacterized protein n=1 Tax=Triparma verrucosa TaxID=1606542 RepID=A0A9W7C9Y3_9STRA|nr:hypothetical protein TrVE_jg12790 [Triparma verrucosa]